MKLGSIYRPWTSATAVFGVFFIYSVLKYQHRLREQVGDALRLGIEAHINAIALIARGQSVQGWMSGVSSSAFFNQVVRGDESLEGLWFRGSGSDRLIRNTFNSRGLYMNELPAEMPTVRWRNIEGKFGSTRIAVLNDEKVLLEKDVVHEDNHLGLLTFQVSVHALAARPFQSLSESPFSSFQVLESEEQSADATVFPELGISVRYTIATAVLLSGISAILWSSILVALAAFALSFVLYRALIGPLWDLMRAVKQVAAGNYSKVDTSPHIGPLKWLLSTYNVQIEGAAKAARMNLDIELAKESERLAKQVSHDIRSPLAVLRMLLPDIASIPENKRDLLNKAVNRVEGIANTLLENSKPRNPSSEPTRDACISITDAVAEIVREKQVELRVEGRPVQLRFSSEYGLFGSIDAVEIKRIISNLINNSRDAIGEQGEISIVCRRKEQTVEIEVSDNGKGMPEEVVRRFGDEGFSYGKTNTGSGNGLGAFHAKKVIRECGGQLTVRSEVGVGTTITMSLPSAPFPKWFLPGLVVREASTIIVVDDDLWIHELWNQKLERHNGCLVVKHFHSAEDGHNWIAGNKEKDNVLVLADLVFRNESISGLELLKEAPPRWQRVLVTQAHKEEVSDLGGADPNIRLLSKSSAAFIPVCVA